MKNIDINELVSIIVPVYNNEDYIDACIKSLIGQTYQNIEIIIINDGSKDSTLCKCEQYREKDSRIRIYSQVNCGVSAARNYGIKIAKGAYISFVDGDDYVEADFIENFISVMPQGGIAVCGYKRLEGNLIIAQYIVNDEMDIELLYRNIFARSEISCGCWNKFFSASIIKKQKILFDEKLFVGEDMVFVAEYLKYTNGKFGYVSSTGYIYRRNMQSMMQRAYHDVKFDLKKFTCLIAVDKLVELNKSSQMEYEIECLSYRVVRTCLWLLFQMICSHNCEKNYFEAISKRIRSNIYNYLKCNEGSKTEHLAALIVCVSPKFVYVIGIILLQISPGFFKKYLK